MHEARVPAEFVEALSPAAISDVARRHERVQHQYCWRAPASRTWEKICASDIVCRKFGVDWTTPSDCQSLNDPARGSAIVRNCVKLVRREFLAFCHVAFHFIPAACVQSVTRLHQVHRHAHEGIDDRCRDAPQRMTARTRTSLRMRLHSFARRMR